MKHEELLLKLTLEEKSGTFERQNSMADTGYPTL